MPFTSAQKKEAYKKLQDEVKDFVMNNETTELIGNLLVEAELSEEERDLADTEIFNSMLELQDLTTTIKNIADITKKDPRELESLKSEIEEKIFNKIYSIKKEFGYKQNIVNEEKTISNNIGNSFEEIILNQAIAMQPARPSDEADGIMNQESGIMNKKDQIPENLPIEEKREESQSKNIHSYKSGQDPYREPLE